MDCESCINIPWRHRKFVQDQLRQLEVFDEVMKEMECQCIECPRHSATGRFDFHSGSLCFETACHCCPCYSREPQDDESGSEGGGSGSSTRSENGSVSEDEEPMRKKPRMGCTNKNCSRNKNRKM